MYRIYYHYMFGRALYTEYFRSEFPLSVALRIRDNLRETYSNVELVPVN